MFKVFAKSMVLCASLALTAFSHAAGSYLEGTHYEVVAEQATTKPEVKEFFSFYCPACFAFDPYVNSLEKSLPDGTVVKKYHVDFMGAASKEIQSQLTQVLVLAKAKGKGAEVGQALFNHIHVKRQPFASAEDIRVVATAAGIDPAIYDKEINSFAVKSQTKLMQKEQEQFSKSKVLNSVPTIIVNGRYKIINQSLDKTNTEQDFKALVQHLLAKP
ncbi:MAG: thiol:disulfide interchange protein DsbA/DsbL [Chromatiaceae bacterium]|jgi:thiol:disulfide interchange protein DsbA